MRVLWTATAVTVTMRSSQYRWWRDLGLLNVTMKAITLTGLRNYASVRRDEKVYPRDTVILRQFGRARYTPSMSGFPLKLETYLRFAQIPYVSVFSDKMSPKNKIPWIEYNGEVVSDSSFIIEYLNEKFNVDLSKHLNPSERATARAFQKMVEEELYWSLSYTHWVDSEQSPKQLEKLLPKGFVFESLVPKIARRSVKKNMYAHGIGRHSKEEIYHIVEKDMRALSDFLGEKKFLFGDEPCEEDCAIFGQLAQMLWQLEGSRQHNLMEGDCRNLMDYCYRMKERFWPDWEQCIMGHDIALKGFVSYPESDPTLYKPDSGK